MLFCTDMVVADVEVRNISLLHSRQQIICVAKSDAATSICAFDFMPALSTRGECSADERHTEKSNMYKNRNIAIEV